MEPNEQLHRLHLLYPKESYEIKAACIAVHSALGCGFLEKVYENALAHELRRRRFAVQPQQAFQVFYDRMLMGDFVVDLLVNNLFIIEIKATEKDHPLHKAQLINYLKASGLPLGFLVNFGQQFFTFQRVVSTRKDSRGISEIPDHVEDEAADNLRQGAFRTARDEC